MTNCPKSVLEIELGLSVFISFKLGATTIAEREAGTLRNSILNPTISSFNNGNEPKYTDHKTDALTITPPRQKLSKKIQKQQPHQPEFAQRAAQTRTTRCSKDSSCSFSQLSFSFLDVGYPLKN